VQLAVLGDPLEYTRSPELHRAGLVAAGMAGESRALRTTPAELGARLRDLADQGLTGVNLTHPLKQAVIAHLARVSEHGRRARSVNTVGFDASGWWGETTDGPGFLDLLRALSRPPAGGRVVLLGAGGAARSLALALALEGAEAVVVSARRPEEARAELADLPVQIVEWRSSAEREALARATLVVNATPLSDPAMLPDPAGLPREAMTIDLAYGESLTPWTAAARRAGREAFDGLGLLVFQARWSLSLWLGREIPLEPLAAAVGWPR
jgi:shikimate dehydrogenase